MSNIVTQLIARAENSLAEAGQRTVERLAVPLKARSQEIVDDAVASVTGAARTIAIKAGLAVAAGLLLIVALVFAFAGLFRYLERLTNPLDALLIMAGLFAVLGIVCVLVLAFWPSKPKPARKLASRAERDAMKAMAETSAKLDAEIVAQRAALAAQGQAAAAAPADNDAAFRSGLDAVMSALGEAGFHREQAGLRAGLTIANQLRPMQIVSLALLGGFLAGIRMTRRKR